MNKNRKRPRARQESSSEEENEDNTESNPQTETSQKRAGHILKMTLKNFMCHSHLEVRFDGNIVFLTGNNGSGKSAILAALTLGLGCKARMTNRGNTTSIKSFIKYGTNRANIEIVLSNSGAQAYKPDVYGSTITVQRNLNIGGTSLYKMKAHNGKVISKLSKDLSEILAALNIQVDNPICILSQDTARSFLNSNDPAVKYNLFFRATRLEHLEQLYRDAVVKKRMAADMFATKKKEEHVLRKEADRLVIKIEEATEVNKLKGKLERLDVEKAWSEAIVAEDRYVKHCSGVEKLQKDHEKLEKQMAEKSDEIEDLQNEKRNLEQQMKDQSTTRSQDIPLGELQAKINQIDSKIREKESTIESIGSQLRYKKEDLETVNKMIANFTESHKSIEERNKSRTEKIEKLRKDEKEAQNVINTYHDEVNKMTHHIKESESKLVEVEHELRAVTNKIGRLNDRLATLKQDNNPLAMYGQQISLLVNAIKSDAQNFSVPPVGPLGSYITIRDKKWTIAIESFLGADLLRTFRVNNWADKVRLERLMSNIFKSSGVRPPSIITAQFASKVHDVSRNIADRAAGCERVFDVLKVDNVVVMNTLIDQAQLESVLLVEDSNHGMDIMSDRNKVPRKCRMVFAANGDNIYAYPDYKFYGGRLKNPKFIQVDCSEASKQCQRELGGAHEQQNDLKRRLPRMKELIDQRGSELAHMKRKFAECKAKVPEINRRICELESGIEHAANIDDLKKESEELQVLITKKKNEINVQKCALQELHEEQTELKDKVNSAKHASQEQSSTRWKLREEIKSKTSEIENLIHARSRIERRITDSRDTLEESQNELHALRERWDKLNADTQSEVGERPNRVRKTDSIIDDIRKIERQINEIDAHDVERAKGNLEKHMDTINRFKEAMKSMKTTLKELDEAKHGRKAKLQETKEYMKEYANFNFRNFLKCRNYQGHMSIDHEKKTLDLTVIPHKGAKTVTPTSNLSGGERSFSTVAFLYALWKTLDFPFYFLDEFDVFMDPQNRSVAIKILIEHAKKNEEAQYVFLTPQDISFIKDDKVTVHRLEDPERGPNEI